MYLCVHEFVLVPFNAIKCNPIACRSHFLLRSGCWRGTSLRRPHASPKAPIWSPETKTSMSSDRYAVFTFPVCWCFDGIIMHVINGRQQKASIPSGLIVLCGSRAGLKQRRGPSGAQRLQKETWLCSGYLWRLLRGTTAQRSTQWHFLAQQMMLNVQPNRQWENKKRFSAKTNALEFNQGLEDVERKTNHQYIQVILLRGRTIGTCL